MVISGVVMLNLVIAILCEALNNLSEEKKKEEEQEKEKERDEEEKGLDPDDEKIYDVQGILYSKNDIVSKFELSELAKVSMSVIIVQKLLNLQFTIYLQEIVCSLLSGNYVFIR